MNTETHLNISAKTERRPMPVALRLAATCAPAAGVTFALFLVMGGLIATDFTPAEATEVYEITSIIPEEPELIEPLTQVRVEPLEALSAPPPPPAITINKGDVDLPTPTITGTPPAEIGSIRVQTLDVRPVAISNRDATPIRPPVVTYPVRALTQGMEGECQVDFDVDVRGRPYNINADCTNNVFKREAERAISKVEFAPKIQDGKSVERTNVVYPLVFSLT